jgi:hypothetical protein
MIGQIWVRIGAGTERPERICSIVQISRGLLEHGQGAEEADDVGDAAVVGEVALVHAFDDGQARL